MPIKQTRKARFSRNAPLVAPSAIEAFLARDLDDWRWLKEVPLGALVDELEMEDFVLLPRRHQLSYLFLGQVLEKFLIHLDMGGGKTKIIIDLIRYRKQLGQFKAALVLVPYVINVPSWEEQLQLHGPDLTYKLLTGTREDRADALDGAPVDVYVMNYTGLQVYVADRVKKRTAKGAPVKRGMKMNLELVYDFAELFNFFVADEVHMIGDEKSLRYQICSRIADMCTFAYGLTGTPFGRDPSKLWRQFKVIDGGVTLSESINMFRCAFMIPKDNPFSGGLTWKFDPKKKALLHEVIQHRSLRYTAAEFSDLPPINFETLHIQLSTEQRKHYAQILEPIADQHGDIAARQNVYNRTRQNTAGFIVDKIDDEKFTLSFPRNPKLDALEMVLLNMPEDAKLIVWNFFIPSGELIKERLRKLKIDFASVGHGTRDPIAQRKLFLTDPKTRVYVVNMKAGNAGSDGWQRVSNYMFFYDIAEDPTTHSQALMRLQRDGQTKPVFVYYACAVGTIDEKIKRAVDSGRSLISEILEGKKIAL